MLSNPIGESMERGTAFLKRQINNAVAQHDRFMWALEDHEEQAEDLRFRDLCSRHIPYMRELQRMLEEYQSQLAVNTGLGREIVGPANGVARDLADAARESDFFRLVGDITMSRRSEDTFKTFREGGKMMGYKTLQEIGDVGEGHHKAYVREANRLVQQMFVEHAQGIDSVARQSQVIRADTST
jgi:hypothetical protein